MSHGIFQREVRLFRFPDRESRMTVNEAGGFAVLPLRLDQPPNFHFPALPPVV